MIDKEKRAFTLIELLAVIVIIGVIALIAVPVVNNMIRQSREKAYQEQVNRLIDKTKEWATENTDLLPNDEVDTTFLTIPDLKVGGYIKNEDVLDPRNNQEMNGCMVITYDVHNVQYVYYYDDMDCETLKDTEYAPIFTVEGIKDVEGLKDEVEVNTVYQFPRVTAHDRTGKELEVSGPVIREKGSTTILSDLPTSIVGKTYELVYTSFDPRKEIEGSITIEVTVVDTTPPTITLVYDTPPDTTDTDFSKSHTISIMASLDPFKAPTAVVTDNSCGTSGTDTTVNGCSTILKATVSGSVTPGVAGTNKLTYTATDASENIKVLILTVIVNYPPKPEIDSVTGIEDGWTNGNQTITVNATDNGGGIGGYSIDGGKTWQTSDEFTITESGEYEVVVKDNFGQVSDSVTINVNIDNSKPSIPTYTMKYNNSSGSNFTNGNWAKIGENLWVGNFSSTDTGGSGIDHYEYSTDCSTGWTQLNGSYTYSTDQNSSYCVRAVDKAGNVSDPSDRIYIKVDHTAPSLTVPADDAIPTTTTSYNLMTGASCTDTNGCTIKTSGSLTLGTVGAYTITYTATDGAGNTTVKTRKIVVYPTDMQLLASLSSNYGTLTKSGNTINITMPFGVKSFTLTATAKYNNVSGLTNPTIKFSNGSTGNGTASTTFTLTNFTGNRYTVTCTSPYTGTSTTYTINVTVTNNQRKEEAWQEGWGGGVMDISGKSGNITILNYTFPQPVTISYLYMSVYQANSSWGNQTRKAMPVYCTYTNGTRSQCATIQQWPENGSCTGGSACGKGPEYTYDCQPNDGCRQEVNIANVTKIEIVYPSVGGSNAYYGYVDNYSVRYYWYWYPTWDEMPNSPGTATNNTISLL